MKTNYAFIPSRELKIFFKQITDQYGAVPPDFKTHAFIKGKEKIYIIDRDVGQIELSNIRINNMGLYIAEVKNDQLRLSIEGSQLIGPHATKNVCELSTDNMKKWFKGEDVFLDGDYSGFIILKHNADFIGSGKYKEDHIINFVPKTRRLQEMH